MTEPTSQPVQVQVASQPRVAAGAGLGMGRVGQAPAQPPAPAKPGIGKKLALAAVVIAVGAAVVIKSITDPASSAVHAPQVQTQVQAETAVQATTGWNASVPAGAWREESGVDKNSPLLGFIATAGHLSIPGQVIAGNGSDLANSVEHISGWQMVALNERGAGHAMGLRPGDIIVSYRGAPVTADSDTINAIHRSGTERALDVIDVGIVRGGQRLVLRGPVGFATSFGALTP